ncbi:MAG: hypothetical protein KKF89_05730, partial [Nanoarchaeota archaeon]|nr:hypothetical protein [Nanoarchaeota archaeon]
GCDCGKLAIYTIQKRLLEIDKSKWNTNTPVVKTQHLTEEQLVFYRNKILKTHIRYRPKRYFVEQILQEKNIFFDYLRIANYYYNNYGFVFTFKKIFSYITGIK